MTTALELVLLAPVQGSFHCDFGQLDGGMLVILAADLYALLDQASWELEQQFRATFHRRSRMRK